MITLPPKYKKRNGGVFILQFFLLGIIVALVGIPILNSLADLIYNLTEVIKSNLSLTIAKNNKTIQSLNEQEIVKSQIGFVIEEEAPIDDEII